MTNRETVGMLRLTQAILDASGCDTPHCGHDHSVLFIKGYCHPRAGVAAAYYKATGTLKITCSKCDKPITEIEVAP